MQLSTCPKCQHERQPNDTAPATECPRCGLIFSKYLAAQVAKNDRAKARPPAAPPPTPPAGPTLSDRISAARHNYRQSADANAARTAEATEAARICKDCGTVHATSLPGHGWIELILWLFMMWPVALVYSVWRRSSKRRVCLGCGSTHVVGLDTPGGRLAAAQFHPHGVPQAPPPPPPAPRTRWGGILVGILLLCAPFGLFMAWQALAGVR